MDRKRQKQLVEALIVAAPEPLPPRRIAEVVPELAAGEVPELVDELMQEHAQQGRGFEIWKVAGGYQLRTRQELAEFVRQLLRERPLRLSRAALETLAVVAYKQPVTRAEVEQVRGVEAGPVLRGLVERRLVRIAGHRDVPGRPVLYATTRRFLEIFGLGRLDDLPTLREIDELLPQPGAAASQPELPGESAVSAESAGEAPGEVAAEAPAESAAEAPGDSAPEAPAMPAAEASGEAR
ncbi:MAG: SMC-Scp complex subunit ScpB [Deltaproteobacteria bacterium]|nr:SMC-Scp complex subunit ScpB [Deltaproteobacteria bacterium]